MFAWLPILRHCGGRGSHMLHGIWELTLPVIIYNTSPCLFYYCYELKLLKTLQQSVTNHPQSITVVTVLLKSVTKWVVLKNQKCNYVTLHVLMWHHHFSPFLTRMKFSHNEVYRMSQYHLLWFPYISHNMYPV